MPFEEQNLNTQDDANVALMKQRLSGFETEQGRLLGLSYVPLRQDEVVITTTPKAGTTWTQQVRTFGMEKLFLLLLPGGGGNGCGGFV
jgi:hypothetical protein